MYHNSRYRMCRQTDPTLARLSSKLQAMNDQYFWSELFIGEPGQDSLFHHNDWIFGLDHGNHQHLCDKLSTSLMLSYEDELIPELVRVITPWYEETMRKCESNRLNSSKKAQVREIKG